MKFFHDKSGDFIPTHVISFFFYEDMLLVIITVRNSSGVNGLN